MIVTCRVATRTGVASAFIVLSHSVPTRPLLSSVSSSHRERIYKIAAFLSIVTWVLQDSGMYVDC